MAESHDTRHPEKSSTAPAQSHEQRPGLSTTQGQGRELTRSPAASPFSFMRRFMSDMDSLFEDFGFGTPLLSRMGQGGLGAPWSEQATLWSPQVDITTRDGQLLIHADLPGLRQEDVNVTVQGDVLTISGQRENRHEESRGGVVRRERSYGSFRREIPLPEGVDPENIKASFESGVLEVSMPLPREAAQQGRTIPITPKPSGGPDVH